MMTPRMKSAFLWAGLVLVALAFLLRVEPERSLAADALVKHIQSLSLWERGFSSQALVYPGAPYDPHGRHFPLAHVEFRNGAPLAVFPVLSAALAAPLAALSGPFGVALAGVFCALAGLVLLRRSWKASGWTLWSAVGATPLLLHSAGFFDVAVANLLLFAGMTLWFRSQDSPSSWKPAVLAGALLGLAVWLRLEAVLFAASLLVAGFAFALPRLQGAWSSSTGSDRADPGTQRWSEMRSTVRPLLGLAAGVLIPGLLFLAFNQIVYDSPLGPRLQANRPGLLNLSNRLEIAQSLLLWGNMRLGFFGYTPLFLPLLGLFLLPGKNEPPTTRERPTPGRQIAMTLLLFMALAVISAPNDSNIDWGTRYLSPAILPLLVLLDRALRRIAQLSGLLRLALFALAIALAVYSVGATGTATKLLARSAKQLAEVQTDLASLQGDVLILENSILAFHIGLHYFERPILHVTDAEELEPVLRRIAQRSPDATVVFAEWQLPEHLQAAPELSTLQGDRRSRYLETLQRLSGESPREVVRGNVRGFIYGPPALESESAPKR